VFSNKTENIHLETSFAGVTVIVTLFSSRYAEVIKVLRVRGISTEKVKKKWKLI